MNNFQVVGSIESIKIKYITLKVNRGYKNKDHEYIFDHIKIYVDLNLCKHLKEYVKINDVIGVYGYISENKVIGTRFSFLKSGGDQIVKI